MSERLRHICRDDWRMFHEKTYARQRIELWGVPTEAQVMHIGRADAPFAVPSRGKTVVIADSGYTWLQLAPENGHWWMTAMYDPAGCAVQYYFDITAGNRLGPGKDAAFADLYLDYVLHPDGGLVEMDRGELEAALASGEISRGAYETALHTGEMLKRRLDPAAMAGFDAIFARLCALQAQTWDEL